MCQLCIHEKGSRQIFNRSLSQTREKCNTELVIRCAFKPCTDDASNLLAIDLQLDVRIACNGLQQKFQYAKYITE